MHQGSNFRFQTNSIHQIRVDGDQIRKEKVADSSQIKNYPDTCGEGLSHTEKLVAVLTACSEQSADIHDGGCVKFC